MIPYSVPANYKLRLVFTSASVYSGTAYINTDNAAYTPVYDYSISNSVIVISNMGPLVIGTTIKVIALIYISTSNLFRVTAYFDTSTVVDAFSSSAYLYVGLVDGGSITFNNFFYDFYDNRFG